MVVSSASSWAAYRLVFKSLLLPSTLQYPTPSASRVPLATRWLRLVLHFLAQQVSCLNFRKQQIKNKLGPFLGSSTGWSRMYYSMGFLGLLGFLRVHSSGQWTLPDLTYLATRYITYYYLSTLHLACFPQSWRTSIYIKRRLQKLYKLPADLHLYRHHYACRTESTHPAQRTDGSRQGHHLSAFLQTASGLQGLCRAICWTRMSSFAIARGQEAPNKGRI